MALINCPECGKEISNKAVSCPNCGCPMGKNEMQNNNSDKEEQKDHVTITTQVKKETVKPKTTRGTRIAGITAIVLGIFALFSAFIGDSGFAAVLYGLFFLIIGIVALNSPNGNRKEVVNHSDYKQKQATASSWIIVSVVIVIVSWIVKSCSDSTKELRQTNKQIANENQAISEQKENENVSNIETSNSIINENIKPEKIFVLDLLENWNNYVGNYVTVSFEVYSTSDYDNNIKIESDYYDELGAPIRATLTNAKNIKEGDWVTITGIVGNDEYDGLENASIDDVGNTSKEIFENAMTEYDERKKAEKEEYKAQFIENAELPSYDDLLRYPDTYKEKQIKVTVKIVRVEPDGIIFDGDIEATMSGETVALYDGRELKEPKLREGDSVTIYGYGKGTTTVKVQDVSGLLPKTIDRYDIPAIDIKYIEF